MQKVVKSDMSIVSVDSAEGIVLKEGISNVYTNLFNGFQREIWWLIRLRNFDRVPKIIKIEYPNRLTESFIGDVITKETVPADWYDQMEYILGYLKSVNCNHNDIKPSEILVKDGKLYLIDYNWATLVGELMPEHPIIVKGLGCGYKRGLIFDDKYSFITSILTVVNGIFPNELKSIEGDLSFQLLKELGLWNQ